MLRESGASSTSGEVASGFWGRHSRLRLLDCPLSRAMTAESIAERSASHRRAKEVLDLEPGALVDELGDAAAVATFRVALVAQQAEPAARGGERRERIELLARLWGREVLLVDCEKARRVCRWRAARRPSLGVPSARRCR